MNNPTERAWEKELREKMPVLVKKIEMLRSPGTMHERFVESGRETVDTSQIKTWLISFIRSIEDAAEARGREEEATNCLEHSKESYERGKKGLPFFFEDETAAIKSYTMKKVDKQIGNAVKRLGEV